MLSLRDPSVEHQTQSEIRYRLRIKYQQSAEVMNRLLNQPTIWDNEKRAGEEQLQCHNCSTIRQFPRYRFETTGETTVRATDWHHVQFITGLD